MSSRICTHCGGDDIPSQYTVCPDCGGRVRYCDQGENEPDDYLSDGDCEDVKEDEEKTDED